MIQPGLLTGSSVDAVSQAIESAKETERRLDAMRQSLPTEFPAKITSYDSTTGACDWTLRSYNANGLRIDHHSGMTGSSTWMPAYPTGNGEMPPPSFPVDVWMRQRLGSSEKGPIFEFDWHCACTAATVGSSGGGSVLSACCPNGIPETLTVTLSSVFDPFLDGMVITLTYVGVISGADLWSGQNSGGSVVIALRCYADGTFGIYMLYGETDQEDRPPDSTTTCDPFSASTAMTFGGSDVTIVITE